MKFSICILLFCSYFISNVSSFGTTEPFFENIRTPIPLSKISVYPTKRVYLTVNELLTVMVNKYKKIDKNADVRQTIYTVIPSPTQYVFNQNSYKTPYNSIRPEYNIQTKRETMNTIQKRNLTDTENVELLMKMYPMYFKETQGMQYVLTFVLLSIYVSLRYAMRCEINIQQMKKNDNRYLIYSYEPKIVHTEQIANCIRTVSCVSTQTDIDICATE